MCCCELLENRVDIITLIIRHIHNPPFLPELGSSNFRDHWCGIESSIFQHQVFILASVAKSAIIDGKTLRDHRRDGNVAVRGIGNLARRGPSAVSEMRKIYIYSPCAAVNYLKMSSRKSRGPRGACGNLEHGKRMDGSSVRVCFACGRGRRYSSVVSLMAAC